MNVVRKLRQHAMGVTEMRRQKEETVGATLSKTHVQFAMAMEVPKPRGQYGAYESSCQYVCVQVRRKKRCRQQFCRNKHEEIRDLTKAEKQEITGYSPGL